MGTYDRGKLFSMIRFSKMLHWLTKKSPGQPARARVADRATLQFSRLEDSLQPFTGNKSLTCKHKNNVINSNISLRGTTVVMPHFATVCTTHIHA